ncbi:hypothetical protein GCM10009799_29190 [Nocardiopsis rhodophaea]|uniref:ABC transporter permease n=1 Tax=Nocardiopsis rhodophaea TaxID=280238 RepID=A0ABN2T7D4_9ACTN
MTARAPSTAPRAHARSGDAAQLVTRHLRTARRAARGRRSDDRAFTVYVGVFAATMAGLSLMSWLASALADPDLPSWANRASGALPAVLTAAALATLWISARDALVRGPLAVDRPMIDWLLSLPVDRRQLLRPLFARALLIRGATGAGVGLLSVAAVGSAVRRLPDDTAPWALFAPALSAGTLLGVLSAAIAVIVLYSRRSRTVMAWLTPVYLAALATLAGIALCAADSESAATPIALASGPWGWAAHGVLASVGAAPVGGWISLGALAVTTTAAVLLADRILAFIPTSALRARADMHAGVRTGMWMSEANWLHDTLREGDGPLLTWLRLPQPPRPWAVVPWRDATGLVRAPSSLVRAWVAVSMAVLAVSAGVGAAPALRAGAAVAGGALLFIAASSLAGGARFTASVPRRILFFPHRPETAVLLHGCAPLIALGALALPAIAAAVLAGATESLLVLAMLPAAVAGVLAGVFRGSLPAHMWIGYETPMGNTAPLQLLGWQAQGPIAVVTVVAPALGAWLPASAASAWTVLATLLLGSWAFRRGRQAVRGGGPSPRTD